MLNGLSGFLKPILNQTPTLLLYPGLGLAMSEDTNIGIVTE